MRSLGGRHLLTPSGLRDTARSVTLTVPMVGTLPSQWLGRISVTGSAGAKGEPQNCAKMFVPIKPSVTLSVPPTGTHIHLTRGSAQRTPPRE